MSCRVAMVVNRKRGTMMFLEPVPKGSARFSYIFFWTVDVLAFKSIYDSTLWKFAVPVLGCCVCSYRKLYPTSSVAQKFYGLLKIHKVGTALRPIVSSRGSITYGMAKELANIIHPLVGQSPHHLKNTQHFV